MERLRQLREEKQYTLDYVAEQLGLRNQYVSNYELGKRRPDYDTLVKFANFYGVTTDYLLGKSNQRTAIDADTPDIYLRLAQGAKQMDLSERDIKTLLDIARTLKERDEQHDQ